MTQLAKRKEKFGIGDLTWLGSKWGVNEARTCTIDVAAFNTATKIVDNYVKAGEPVKEATAGGKTKMVPYAGTGTLAGFILTDVPADPTLGDAVAPLLDHGRVILSKLPPGHGVTAAATTSGQFIFVA